jgi:2-haloacid dehalogenase
VTLSSSAVEEVLRSYGDLDPFPDVAPMMDALRAEDIPVVVFTNGTAEQFRRSRAAQLALDCVSVDDDNNDADANGGKKFKPRPTAYRRLLDKLGVPAGEEKSVVLVSGNPFDIVGARSVGIDAIWVDRDGKGWSDGLGTPTIAVNGLGEVIEWVKAQTPAVHKDEC